MAVGPEMTPLTIRDFTPGIYSNTNFQGALALSAPLGSAQETNTYRCIGYPNGGLGPLPTYYAKYTLPTSSATRVVVGLITIGRVTTFTAPANSLPDNIYIWTDESAGGTLRTLKFFRLNVSSGTPVVTDLTTISVKLSGATIGNLNTFVTAVNGQDSTIALINSPGAVSSERTRILLSPTATVGSPMFVWNWPYVNNTTTHTSLFTFPSQADPIHDTLQNFEDATSGPIFPAAYVIAHESRIIYETEGLNYDGDYSTSGYSGSRVSDPPEYTILFSPSQYYSVENSVAGYGAWGSISTGELILINKSQGAIQISGDLLFPTVTKLPGVQGTGQWTSKGISCSRGFLYAVHKGGIYSWNGGNLSQKVSSQLRDDFFERATTTFGVSMQSTLWNDWVMYPNNFFLDTLSGGWWRIDNPSEFMWTTWDYSCSDSRFCIAAIDSYASGSTNQIAAFDRTKLASSWSWQSQPIPQSVGTKIQVQECEILATSLTGGTITVTLTGSDNTLSTVTFTLIALSQPQRLRMRLASQEWNVIVRIVATDVGFGSAPILNEITLFFTDGNPTSVS